MVKEHEKEVYSIDWCHTGSKNFIVSGSWDRTCKIWDSNAMQLVNSFDGHHGVVYSTVWSPHFNGCFASASGDHGIFFIDICYLSFFLVNI